MSFKTIKIAPSIALPSIYVMDICRKESCMKKHKTVLRPEIYWTR